MTSRETARNDQVQRWKTSCLEASSTVSREELQADAETFFRQSTSDQTSQEQTPTNVSFHEQALAYLIQELGPAFVHQQHSRRLMALYVLSGALKGCKHVPLSLRTKGLLIPFLLGHSGPIDSDDQDFEDYESLIRDIALQTLSSLVLIPTAFGAVSREEQVKSLVLVLESATKAVQLRCALPESEEDHDPYGFQRRPPSQDMRGGLSLLPRSKRAVCFQLLQDTTSGVANTTLDTQTVSAPVQRSMVKFARFVSNCLLGESDPRCLQQLLRLIHSVQTSFHPFFKTCQAQDTIFPTEEVFDVVSQYFPIQFTPPPNDIHGITREGLHSDLLHVLTFTAYDKVAVDFHRPLMVQLSTELFMEQFLPDEEMPGPLDKLEALEALSVLLFPTTGSSPLSLLEPSVMTSLANAMKQTHDEASLGVSQGGQAGSENKNLADQSRIFVAKLAFQLELLPNKGLWEAFVADTLQRHSPTLKKSPSNGKASIAYMACLASSGGSRTLRSSLSLGMEPLLDFLETRMDDNEDTAVATHGIGAFLSSCRVAVDRAVENGVTLHPHPLEAHSGRLASLLLDAFENAGLSESIKVGAARALECFLNVALEEQVQEETLQRICSFLNRLLALLANTTESSHDYGLILGNLLGVSLKVRSQGESKLLLYNETLEQCIKDQVYGQLLQAVGQGVEDVSRKHYLGVLAKASSNGVDVAGPIMGSCLDILSDTLQSKGLIAAVQPAATVKHLLSHGGETSIRAYHDSPQVSNVFDSLESFARTRARPELRISIIKLSLPESDEERQRLSTELQAAKTIVASLLPAYKQFVPPQILIQLLKTVSDSLPPLSQIDNFKLSTLLPFLGESLRVYCENKPTSEEADATVIRSTASSMMNDLADIVTSTDFDQDTRSVALSCLREIIIVAEPSEDCLVAQIVKSVISPVLCSTVDSTKVHDSLYFLATLGSAAASRGGSSGKNADVIADFLLTVAAKGNAPIPFSESSGTFDTGVYDHPKSVELITASAYGSMLLLSAPTPIPRQRLTHASFRYLEEGSKTLSGDAPTSSIPIGILAIASHIMCTTDIAAMNTSTLTNARSVLLRGLQSGLFQPVNSGEEKLPISAKNQVLVAILKILTMVRQDQSELVMPIATGLLRVYAMCDTSKEITCKLLALQCLDALAKMPNVKSKVSTVQPAVVALLAAATNHPKGVLRQAAAEVRNTWYVLE
eukprot:Nitzschia sp. Nitz4//scaffold162_size51285//42345//45968//NITZ4_006977-RA/size51285-processed-gene-0.92-mRNA-1//1//CDS//3329537997//7062//frame0